MAAMATIIMVLDIITMDIIIITTIITIIITTITIIIITTTITITISIQRKKKSQNTFMTQSNTKQFKKTGSNSVKE